MAVTPEQIEGAAFSTVKRGGYRTEEVDRFLRTLADEVRSLNARVRAAEGANEDLQAASAEMATLMKDVHAQLGEKRRLAENEVQEMLHNAERDAAGIIAGATEQADAARIKSDRVLADAERHAELLRSDGEQRVREQAQETLRSARSELQDLVRRKHELLNVIGGIQADLGAMHATLEATAISPEAIDDDIVDQTLIDLREAQAAAAAAAAPAPAPAPAPTVPPATADHAAEEPAPAAHELTEPAMPEPAPGTYTHPAAPPAPGTAPGHPAGSGTFFSPPEE